MSNSKLDLSNISTVKENLANYNIILDGRRQQDAHECFFILLDIIHAGTKYNLVDGGDCTDDCVMSNKKDMFSSIASVKYDCSSCSTVSGFVSVPCIRVVNIKPTKNSPISKLIHESYTVSLTKNCTSCACDTEHLERTTLLQPPQYLVILINRFSFQDGIELKIETPILLENVIKIKEHFFCPRGIIHHHGSTLRSGHYTASIISQDTLYTCDDDFISSKDVVGSFECDSAYMIFYKLSESL